MVDVSVVIISWKMKELLTAMLASVQHHTHGVSYELIVVDNASMDGTAEVVVQEYPQARLLKNPENRGVAPARNQAFRIAQGRYIVTLDADMVLVENSLRKMAEFMDSNPDAGICGCKLTFPDGTVQPSSRRFPTLFAQVLRRLQRIEFVRNSKTLRHHEMAEWDRCDTREVDYVIGACQFIRKAAIDQIGLLDEEIFYGPEDVDYCMRMKRAGWKTYYYPHTKIVHYEQRVTKKKLFSKLSLLHLKGVLHLYRKYGWKLD